jgi:hypothetical protein
MWAAFDLSEFVSTYFLLRSSDIATLFLAVCLAGRVVSIA